MGIRNWSSDVCSSDLQSPAPRAAPQAFSLPMPAPQTIERQPNSLWRPGSRAFLKDQRASDVGDILTVIIEIQDNAAINNTTTRSRAASEDASASAFLGYEASLSQRSEEHTSELQSLMRNSYAVLCLKKKK